ncbi:hypothetical protein BGX38DRAFT_1214828 [Terfezia claveryi]|nr:hypothetical protein BGX38DRAFT_1214828 [Terfezia claveryi]
MKAMKGVEISYEEDTRKFPTFKPRHFPLEGEPIEVSEKNDAGKTSGVRRRKGGTSSEGKPRIKAPKTDTQPDDEEEEPSAPPPIKKDPRDPLKWFGIFVPPVLKVAQLRFSDALNQLPYLVTVLRNLDWHEEEIRKLEKQVKEEQVHKIEIRDVGLHDSECEKGES